MEEQRVYGAMKKLDTNSVEEAVETAGLNWNVEEHGLMLDNLTEVKTHKAILRGDNLGQIGIVGVGYNPVQNAVAFSLIDEVVHEYDGVYKFGGCFDGGRRVVLQAKLNKTFDVNGNDEVDMYMTLVNAHDGSSAFKMMVTPIRLFCMNQLNVATKNAVSAISIRHTSNAMQSVEKARYAFRKYASAFADFEETAIRLSNKFADSAMVTRFIDSVVGTTYDTNSERSLNMLNQKREKIEQLFVSGKGNKGETLWDLYNGATEYVDHYMFAGGKDAQARREKSAMFGQGQTMKLTALETAVSML